MVKVNVKLCYESKWNKTSQLLRVYWSHSPQVIEDPVEIVDNERELKGFFNLNEDIKLVGYFKSENSRRKYWPICATL